MDTQSIFQMAREIAAQVVAGIVLYFIGSRWLERKKRFPLRPQEDAELVTLMPKRRKLRVLYDDVLFPLIVLAAPVYSVYTSYTSAVPFGKEYVLGLSFSVGWFFFTLLLMLMRFMFGLVDLDFKRLRDLVSASAHPPSHVAQIVTALPKKKSHGN